MIFNFKNKLINGDSLEELKKIPDETFDLIFADPPYYLGTINYYEIIEKIFTNQLLFDQGLLIIEHGEQEKFEEHSRFLEFRKYGNNFFSFFE